MYIDNDKPGDPGTLSIPFKSWNRDNAAAADWMFGLAGSLVYSLANSLEGAENVKVISLETNENFTPDAGFQIVPVAVHVKASAERKLQLIRVSKMSSRPAACHLDRRERSYGKIFALLVRITVR